MVSRLVPDAAREEAGDCSDVLRGFLARHGTVLGAAGSELLHLTMTFFAELESHPAALSRRMRELHLDMMARAGHPHGSAVCHATLAEIEAAIVGSTRTDMTLAPIRCPREDSRPPTAAPIG